jgi:hypothetical protein
VLVVVVMLLVRGAAAALPAMLLPPSWNGRNLRRCLTAADGDASAPGAAAAAATGCCCSELLPGSTPDIHTIKCRLSLLACWLVHSAQGRRKTHRRGSSSISTRRHNKHSGGAGQRQSVPQ